MVPVSKSARSSSGCGSGRLINELSIGSSQKKKIGQVTYERLGLKTTGDPLTRKPSTTAAHESLETTGSFVALRTASHSLVTSPAHIFEYSLTYNWWKHTDGKNTSSGRIL